MFRRTLAACLAALLLPAVFVQVARAASGDTLTVSDPARFGIIVSATKTAKSGLDVPNATALVRGEDLRRTGAHTLADALIDVAGLETGGGTDNGSRLPNIGLWGLKEFDALLITVDGVPVGGPFNPALEEIPVEDIDHIEIVKGPQGTLYGVSAFAGMIQVFTDHSTEPHRTITVGGGEFSNLDGRIDLRHGIGNGWTLGVSAAGNAGDGWQERTHSKVGRGHVSLAGDFGKAHLGFDLIALSDRADWGTPMPVDLADPTPGFDATANYAVPGAKQTHSLLGITQHLTLPAGSSRFENTFDLRHDRQESVRNFFSGFPDSENPDIVSFAGVAISPVTNTLFDDARLVTTIAGHELVTGAALTWGRTTATGIGFDVDESLAAMGRNTPALQDIPVGDHRSFSDDRTFFGVYAHDAWTPMSMFTLSGGGRWDRAHEKLHAFGQEVGAPDAAITDDEKTSSAWSGDLSALVRLLPEKGAHTLNAYANWKSSFKPAAPNLTEAEDAHILDPEHTHSIEGGFKGTLENGQVAFDASMFQMDFTNMVVGAVDADGNPTNINAGKERFKGIEASVTLRPDFAPGLTLNAGWANHDPRFVDFKFFADPADPASLTNVGGNQIELAPTQMWNMRGSYTMEKRLTVWAAARHENKRPMKRRKQWQPERWTPPFTEFDMGASYTFHGATWSITGRNLGDDRHWVAESDMGDSQFYYAPPRRFSTELTFPF